MTSDKDHLLATSGKALTQMQLIDLLELIRIGKQIPGISGAKKLLLAAESIVILYIDDVIISTATVKNPNDSYRKKVFAKAGIAEMAEAFQKELGYVCTRPEYEGQGHCQRVLAKAIQISTSNLFSTTRKESMKHILKKFGFNETGVPYDEGLVLLTKRARLI